jgi:hypothetical protein
LNYHYDSSYLTPNSATFQQNHDTNLKSNDHNDYHQPIVVINYYNDMTSKA